LFFQAGQEIFDLCNCVPSAREQHHHRKAVAEHGHAAVDDVATTFSNGFHEGFDESLPICSNCGYGDVVKHGMKLRNRVRGETRIVHAYVLNSQV
jgi:hypothetical protein